MVNDSETAPSLGEWGDGGFDETVSQHGGTGFGADLPDENRFVFGVAQLLRRRRAEAEARGESDPSDIAVFVLQPRPPESVQGVQRVPMVDNGLTSVSGRLWFASAAVASAHFIELPGDTDDGRFTYVAEELGLGEQPTLIYDPRPSSPQLRWYSQGLNQPNNVESKQIEGDVEPADVFEAIHKLYCECLATPSGLPSGGNLWQNVRRHHAGDKAEALIQSILKAGLALRFPFCKIWHEQPQLAGRSDLAIQQWDPMDHAVTTQHAIIELKVLRSYGAQGASISETKTREWISEGVDQAAAYRDEKGYQWSALCCFDMRTQDVGDTVCFNHVQSDALDRDVWLKRWFLYANFRAYRRVRPCS